MASPLLRNDYETKVELLKRIRDNTGGWVNVAERVKELENVLEAFKRKETITVSKSIAAGISVAFVTSSLSYVGLQKVLENEVNTLKDRILGADPITGSYKEVSAS